MKAFSLSWIDGTSDVLGHIMFDLTVYLIAIGKYHHLEEMPFAVSVPIAPK